MKELVFEELKENMEKVIRALEKSFSKVRTGRASLALLDGIKVEYYGVPTPLNQVATLSIPESRMIMISPWDSTIIGSIEKAIQKSELGLMPVNDGKLIRINIPQLTEERRKDLVKVVKKMAEECKINLRNARRDANDQLKRMMSRNSRINILRRRTVFSETRKKRSWRYNKVICSLSFQGSLLAPYLF
jgi:ribosome recycling factor